MTTIFVAAEAFELQPFSRLLTGANRLPWPVEYAVEGLWQQQRTVLIANGMGRRLAAQAVRVAMGELGDNSGEVVQAIVSVGLCGGLSPELRLADIVVASEIHDGSVRSRVGMVSSAGSYRQGFVLSIDRVLGTIQEKTKAYQLGDMVVEMEAAGVAYEAAQAKVPFFCIKAVSDTASEGLPFDLNDMRTNDGRLARGKIIVYALLRPKYLPALVRLKKRSDFASRMLGDFLVSCRLHIDSRAA